MKPKVESRKLKVEAATEVVAAPGAQPVRTTAVVMAAVVAWSALTQWVVPRLLELAHGGTRLPFISWLLRTGYPLEEYLTRWSQWSVYLTVAGALAVTAYALRSRLEPRLRAAPVVRTAGLLTIALWWGLLSGLFQTALPLVREGLTLEAGLLTGLLWMVPAAGATALLALGGVAALVARPGRSGVSLRLAMTVFGTLVLYGAIHSLGFGIHPLAVLLLSAGIAWQTASIAAKRSVSFLKLVRISVAAMATLVVIMVVSARTYEWRMEQLGLGRLPAAPAGASNVIFVILDTVRAQSLSLYGYERPTSPRLQALAQQGAVFERAVSTSPWTLPSHGSFFTGRLPYELSAGLETALDGTHPTIAEVLRDRGYLTAGFVANLMYAGRQFGLGRGFVHYEDYRPRPMTALASYWLSHALIDVINGLTRRPSDFWSPRAEDINRRLLRWLDRSEGRPFFAFVNYFDAHVPYVVKQPFWRSFASRPPRPWLYTGDRDYGHDELTELRDSYDAAIAYTDHQLGMLLDELERRGVLDNTLVIVSSDHGEQFGGHGLTGHGNSLYIDLLHVPLVMAMPGRIPSAVRSAESVTLRDIPATIMDVLELQGSTFPGKSLRRYWTPAPSRRAEPALSELAFEGPRMMRGPIHRGSMQSLVMGDHHYIRNGDGVEELYDLFGDPREQNDLSGKPESRPQLSEFRKIVESAIPTAELGRVARSPGER